ncbi:hypothetical protein NMZ99_004645 [Vibrio parahaemolyticus]|uniref:hypothetical protein n=1 Tax=Vibrio parahaemolyticus TaxID=670 RepID=UPI000B048B9C|nr:hypothetical protein [Vibrio parahaemolyticus]EJG1164780.1 hypothetical protein [Vibrio parahaemolyticus]EJL8304578.1 hypothetical protein [Vibrio parahaemolyticus]EJU9846246.1 hypothetical protein [Vibrio parahaemolyticus]HAS6589570.1 hypothetical protein [Vibrio parahaemolyticus]
MPSSILVWQLSRQLAIVLRFGWKDRALVVTWSGYLIGREVDLLVLGWSPLVVTLVPTLCFSSVN